MQEQDNNVLAQTFQQNQLELKDIDVNYISMVVGLIKERATFISDFWDLGAFFFTSPKSYDEKAYKKAMKEDSRELMSALSVLINSIEDFELETLTTTVKTWITNKEIGFGKVMMPLRLALVGALQGPDVFDIMYMIGKAETVERIENLATTI
jgi:glutamyl-tRNA synthetase